MPPATFPNAPGDLDDTWAGQPGNEGGLQVQIDTGYANVQPDDTLTLYVADTRTNPPQVPPFSTDRCPPMASCPSRPQSYAR